MDKTKLIPQDVGITPWYVMTTFSCGILLEDDEDKGVSWLCLGGRVDGGVSSSLSSLKWKKL